MKSFQTGQETDPAFIPTDGEDALVVGLKYVEYFGLSKASIIRNGKVLIRAATLSEINAGKRIRRARQKYYVAIIQTLSKKLDDYNMKHQEDSCIKVKCAIASVTILFFELLRGPFVK